MSSYLQAVPMFAAYFVGGVGAWALALAIYVRLTPYREFALASQGNVAAAASLGGVAIGLALPIASLLVHAVNLVDLLAWAMVALLAQLALWFVVARLLMRSVSEAVTQGRTAAGVVLGSLSIAVGLLNAASLTW